MFGFICLFKPGDIAAINYTISNHILLNKVENIRKQRSIPSFSSSESLLEHYTI